MVTFNLWSLVLIILLSYVIKMFADFLFRALFKVFSFLSATVLPRQVLMLLDDETDGFLRQRLPVISSMSRQDGVAAAFVCQDFTCSLPVTDALDLRRLLLDGTIDAQTA